MNNTNTKNDVIDITTLDAVTDNLAMGARDSADVIEFCANRKKKNEAAAE